MRVIADQGTLGRISLICFKVSIKFHLKSGDKLIVCLEKGLKKSSSLVGICDKLSM